MESLVMTMRLGFIQKLNSNDSKSWAIVALLQMESQEMKWGNYLRQDQRTTNGLERQRKGLSKWKQLNWNSSHHQWETVGKNDGDQSQHRLRFRCLLIHRWRWWWMCINFKSTIKLIFKINDCEKGIWMKEKWKSNEVEEVKWKIRANGIIITNVRKAKEIFKKMNNAI